MVETRRGLGRGLSALLGEAEAEAGIPARLGAPQPGAADTASASASGAPREAPIELLRRNPDQPRRRFDEAELAELASSIASKGVLQPILVRPAADAPGEWQIVAGERRWRAAQAAGLHAVPILVRELSDAEVLEIGIVENVQRADLDALEEAQGYDALIQRFGHTQAEVAQVVGKSRAYITNALRLLALPAGVQAHVAAGRLSGSHARAIAAAPDPSRLAEQIVTRGLSVRQAEGLARDAQAPERPARSATRGGGVRDADLEAIEQDLAGILGLKVKISNARGGGDVTVSYRTLEQLDDVLRRLMGA